MSTCLECSASLAPEWKYCIRCGAEVERIAEVIPGAIRPDDDPAEAEVMSPLALFGWSLAGILVAIGAVATLVAVFFRP